MAGEAARKVFSIILFKLTKQYELFSLVFVGDKAKDEET
jgi:hypothetical protein